MSAATAWELAFTVSMVGLLVGLTWVGYVLFVKHDPTPDGLTCGWSGCPFCTERNHQRRAR